ncbi:MAG: hypothetical protein ACRYG5_12100 [Janthinobacterium lividum]
MAAGAVSSIRINKGASEAWLHRDTATLRGTREARAGSDVLAWLAARRDMGYTDSLAMAYRPLRTSLASVSSLASTDSQASCASTASSSSTVITTCSDAAFGVPANTRPLETLIDAAHPRGMGRRCLSFHDGERVAERLAQLEPFFDSTVTLGLADKAEHPLVGNLSALAGPPAETLKCARFISSPDASTDQAPDSDDAFYPTALRRQARAPRRTDVPLDKTLSTPSKRRLVPRCVANTGRALWGKLLCVAGPTMLRCGVLNYLNQAALSAGALAALTYAAFGLPIVLSLVGVLVDACRGQMTWHALAARSVGATLCVTMMAVLACCGVPPGFAPQLVALVSYCVSRDAIQSVVRIVNRNDPQCRQSIRALLVTAAIYAVTQFTLGIGQLALSDAGGAALQAFCHRFEALIAAAFNTVGETLDELVICYLMRAFQRKAHPQGPVKLRVAYKPSALLNVGNWLCVTSPARMTLFFNVTLMGTLVLLAYGPAQQAGAAAQRLKAAFSCAMLGSLYSYFHMGHWRREPAVRRDAVRRARRHEAYAIAQQHRVGRHKRKPEPSIFSFWMNGQAASLPKP